MDATQAGIGIGVSIVFGCLQLVKVPAPFAWGGFAVGITTIICSMVPLDVRPNLIQTVLYCCGAALIAGTVAWQITSKPKAEKPAAAAEPTAVEEPANASAGPAVEEPEKKITPVHVVSLRPPEPEIHAGVVLGSDLRGFRVTTPPGGIVAYNKIIGDDGSTFSLEAGPNSAVMNNELSDFKHVRVRTDGLVGGNKVAGQKPPSPAPPAEEPKEP